MAIALVIDMHRKARQTFSLHL